MAGETFKCWGCDHSFTQEIRQEWNPPPDSGVELAMFEADLAASPPQAGPAPTPPQAAQTRILLSCDHATPHTNVFSLPPPAGPNPIVGGHPTPDDTFWQGSIQQLTPDKSIATLDSQARWIFTSVGIIGTALTGFTILAATRLQAAPWWLTGPTVVLTAASLILAALALVPDTGQFHPANLTEVQDTWNRDIRTRRWKVRLSSITFAAAIAIAATTALVVNSQPSQDGVTTLQVAGTGASEALSATVTLSSLPAGASIATTVQGSNASGTKITLFTDNTTADSTGSAKVTAAVPNVSSFLQFFVTSTVTSNRAVVRTETATLTPSS